MKQNIKRLLCCILAVLLVVPAALAAGDTDFSLTVEFPCDGMEFKLYHVAEVGPDSRYVKTEAFQDCSVDLSQLYVGETSTQADAFMGYVWLFDMPATATGTVGRKGSVTFSHLTPGLYLVLAGQVQIEEHRYTALPLLISVPMPNAQTGMWDYNVTISPKPGELPGDDDTTRISRKVLKVWEDDAAKTQRPQSVKVYLLRDGELYDVVELSADNNWRYRWDSLPSGHVWAVVERPVDGYSTSIEQKGITFVITNTLVSTVNPDPGTPPDPGADPSPGIDPEPSPGADPDPVPGTDPVPTPSVQPTPTPSADPGVPTLPQTGLLWWPVPVLACAGLLLFTLGWVRHRRDEDE